MNPRASAGPAPEVRVDPAAYTEAYYLSSCEGFESFQRTGGQRLSPRLVRALELARVRPGQRLLDIGCGRGELVLHAASRGALAFGIDYASAATNLAQRTVTDSLAGQAGRARTGPRLGAAVGRMDATRLAFPSETFDTVLMLDLVEHLYPRQLAQALGEVLRVLKPSGRLIVHTSPNRLFEEVVYPHYVRRVHRAVLALARRLGLRGRLLNPVMLPTAPQLPHNEYERRLHVNGQTAGGLCALLRKHGFHALKVSFWEPPSRPIYASWGLGLEVQLLDVIRYLHPFSRSWPLNRLFSNHIWITARRPGRRGR